MGLASVPKDEQYQALGAMLRRLCAAALALPVLLSSCASTGVATPAWTFSAGGADTSESSAWPLAAGPRHACARRSDGPLVCWGDGSSGQLGDGGNEPRPTPAVVSGASDTVGLGLGARFSCALSGRGRVVCFGDDEAVVPSRPAGGALSAMRSSTVVVPISAVRDAVAIAAGPSDVCVLTRAHDVLCWGEHAGDVAEPRHVALPVAALGDAARALVIHGDAVCASGGSAITCAPLAGQGEVRTLALPSDDAVLALVADATSLCVVHGAARTLSCATHAAGDGPAAFRAVGVDRVRAVAVAHGTLWLADAAGHVTTAPSQTLSRRAPVPELDGAERLAAGDGFVCGRIGTRVVCVGRNDAGQRGDGTIDVSR